VLFANIINKAKATF